MPRLLAMARWLLENLVNGHRLNDSFFYGLYVHIRHPNHARRKKVERQFYRQVLEAVAAKLVFDIGANTGSKTAIFSALVEKVVSVEPDSTAIKILKERFLYNPKVVILAKGVGAEEEVSKFHVFDNADCYNTFSQKWANTLATPATSNRPSKESKVIIDIPITTLDQLIKEYGVPSYIKIDVEGFEVNVLKGLTKNVPLLSFECNLPEFAPETSECLSILAKRCSTAEFNYCVTEPPARFESERWISYEKMSIIVEAGAKRFMEIFCRSL